MHQEPVHRAHRATAVLILAIVERMHDADLLGPLPSISKLGRVLQNQDGTLCFGEAAARRLEARGKKFLLAGALLGKEAIGCLGASQVEVRAECLLPWRSPFASRTGGTLSSDAAPQSQIGKLTTTPCVCRSVHGTVLRDSVPDKESPPAHPAQELSVNDVTGRLKTADGRA